MENNHRRSDVRKGYLIIAIIVIVLVVVMAGLFLRQQARVNRILKEQLALQQQELEKLQSEEAKRQEESEQQAQLELQAKLEREQLMLTDSFYQKLADQFDVNILIVGDSIGCGSGASDEEHGWANLLARDIESTYGVNVKLTNVSMRGNSSYAGYVRTMMLEDDIDYDLVVLCYGQNDSISNFSLYYEAMIRGVKNKYPKASILSVLESSQRDYTVKIQDIQYIASHYEIPVADTIAAFKGNYDALLKDSVHPNDAGHLVYMEQVKALIDSFAAQRKGYDTEGISVINEQVTAFDRFQKLDVSSFTRIGNTYTLKTSTEGTILGIDYNLTSGANSCRILIDGMEYEAPEMTFDYDFSQRRILVVNNWMNGEPVMIRDEIQVIFGEDEAGTVQADGFGGLFISG